MTHHAEPFDAEACGEAAPALRIQSQTLQNGGIHHAAPHHLQPAPPPLHIHLGRWFGEGEVAGTEANGNVSEKCLQKGHHRAAQMAEIETFVDGENLNLMEHSRVGRIGRIPPIHPSWRDDPRWRRVLLEVADLNR